MHERFERGLGLEFVVVPGEAVEAEPGERRAARQSKQRAQGVLAERSPHGFASARRRSRLERRAVAMVGPPPSSPGRPRRPPAQPVHPRRPTGGQPTMPSLLDLTSQGDVGTIADESKLASITLMTPAAALRAVGAPELVLAHDRLRAGPAATGRRWTPSCAAAWRGTCRASSSARSASRRSSPAS